MMTSTGFLLAYMAPLLVHAAKPPGVKASVRVLSEEPRIEYLSNFISRSDAAALRKLANRLGFEAGGEDSATRDANGGSEVCVLNRTEVVDEAIEEADAQLSHDGWAAAARFEAASAEWAELPLGSSSTVIARWEPWVPGFNRSGLLHLDGRLRPFNQRTVLAYLGGHSRSDTSAIDSDAGFTVFPCVETEDLDEREAKRRRRLCSRAFRHVRLIHDQLLKTHAKGLELKPSQQLDFLKEHPELTSLPKVSDGGVRPIDLQWSAAHDAVAESSDAVRADALFAIADAMCHGKAPGLRIRPEAGAAVLLESAALGRDGALVPDWMTWHAGCSPDPHGGNRWTAQLFLDGADARRVGSSGIKDHIAVAEKCSRSSGHAQQKECAKPKQA